MTGEPAPAERPAAAPAPTPTPSATTQPNAVAEAPPRARPGLTAEQNLALVESQRYLNSLPATGYVLQVMASRSFSQLQAFWDAQTNRDELNVHESLRGGQMMYLLVQGYYPNLTSAREGARNLPATQADNKAFPKSLRQVRTEMEAADR